MGEQAKKRPRCRKEFGVRNPAQASVTAEEWEKGRAGEDSKDCSLG